MTRGKPATAFGGMEVAFWLVFEGMDRIRLAETTGKRAFPPEGLVKAKVWR